MTDRLGHGFLPIGAQADGPRPGLPGGHVRSGRHRSDFGTALQEQSPTVGEEADRGDLPALEQRAGLLTRLHVPDADGRFRAMNRLHPMAQQGKSSAIRAKHALGRMVDRPTHLLDQLTAADVPDLCLPGDHIRPFETARPSGLNRATSMELPDGRFAGHSGLPSAEVQTRTSPRPW